MQVHVQVQVQVITSHKLVDPVGVGVRSAKCSKCEVLEVHIELPEGGLLGGQGIQRKLAADCPLQTALK